jgi:uncharacterized protein (DUF1501 family)
MKGHDRKGMAVKDAKLLYYTTREPFFRSILNLQKENSLSKGNLDYLYKTMIETSSSAEYIYETQKTYENKSEYPQTKFAHQLKTVSTFINSGLNTRVYYVSLSGFDTHTNQTNQQERLLKEFSEGVSAFLKDLKQTSRLDETLVVTFSEFGRRVEQNASNGTDHGTAGNMFVFGSKLNKLGIYNDAPDLTDLEDGDLKYTTDFRSVYATVLEKWLSVSPYDILNNNFPKLDFI